MKNNKKLLLIFDLDGVIFNSKKNMQSAWIQTSKKFQLNIPFKYYFREIGKPFLEILKSLGVQPKADIYEYFKQISLREIDKIKPYKGAVKQLKLLKKNKIKFSIVTSKDIKRTKILLKKFDIKPNTIHCPNNKLRGKPYPDHLLRSVKMNKMKSSNACFIGDTKIDYLAAKRAKIDFIFAKYGYGEDKIYYKNKIQLLNEISKFI